MHIFNSKIFSLPSEHFSFNFLLLAIYVQSRQIGRMIHHVPITQPLSTCGHSSFMSNPTHFPSSLLCSDSRHYFTTFSMYSTCISKREDKVYLTCLVVILFTVVDVFTGHIVFHYITYFISATSVSFSLSYIISFAFRKLYVFCSNRYLLSIP